MEQYLCIHGHFYQPPRENPWLEAVEIQDSAHPYHDWNERVSAECYAPNTASRILDGDKKILDILNNYSGMSFNFGPTLLAWLEKSSPDIYQSILDADRKSMELRSGHGSAIAQVYNHLIMPLANKRDRKTQVTWGIEDFKQRFRRFPEGMWLSETAVDNESLAVLSESGIKYTILSPHQALRIRKIGTGKWRDVSGRRIDPARAYLCRLPGGASINVFFYDAPISQAVAFEKILDSGEKFIGRLLTGYSGLRDWPQLLNIATDGESYGHHHNFGDMALAYTIHHIEAQGLIKLTNYGEYLEKHPPTHEVEIIENSSWSCIHGLERWKSHCGCNSGGYSEWNQEWRGPLRDALDWLRDKLAERFENGAEKYLNDPWDARNDYITVIHDRSEENIGRFLSKHGKRMLTQDEKRTVLKLLEIQRHAMLMYTSCGWFFDELSGIETVQVMQYAGRAIQLAETEPGESLESQFLERLSQAKSNLPQHQDGRAIYEKFVKPAMINLNKVGVHYAIRSLFEEYPEVAKVYCYNVTREDYHKMKIGKKEVAIGKICVTSDITQESECLSFCVSYFGNHDLYGGVRAFLGEEDYNSMKEEMIHAFQAGAFAEIIRLMDRHFGMHNYSLRDLFRDEQRRILNIIVTSMMDEFEKSYRRLYTDYRPLVDFLRERDVPVPRAFNMAADFVLTLDMKRAFEDGIDKAEILRLVHDIRNLGISWDYPVLEFIIRRRIEDMMKGFQSDPSNMMLLLDTADVTDVTLCLPFKINLWQAQNVYYKMTQTVYHEYLNKADAGDSEARHWLDRFKHLGEGLFFNVQAILPGL